MMSAVFTQEVVGDDYMELAEANDLGATELPWHFDYFEEDSEQQ